MTEEWIVRVQGKEYGPVDTDELREWRREGRLIAANEVRRVEEEQWFPAGELPEVFADEVQPEAQPPPVPQHFEMGKSLSQIVSETFRIYRQGFFLFLVFGLVAAIPFLFLRLSLPPVPMPDFLSGNTSPSPEIPDLPSSSVVLLMICVLAWPISAAGFQIVADNILRNRIQTLSAQFSAALRCWGRVLGTAILVYGSYLFWIFVPLLAMIASAGTGNLLLIVMVITFAGAFMMYMNARLFINFLFWQQTTALEDRNPMLALQESRELARSIPEAPPMERPLYRGAILASFWFLLFLALTFGANLIVVMTRLAGIDDPEQGLELARTMAQAPMPDGVLLAANIAAAVIGLLLQPLLAIAFVVLFYDAKARSGKIGVSAGNRYSADAENERGS